MEYVIYLIASVISIIVMHRVRKAWLAKGYKRGICSIAAGVLGLCAFFFVIVMAVSLGVFKPQLPDAKVAQQKPAPVYASDIPQ